MIHGTVNTSETVSVPASSDYYESSHISLSSIFCTSDAVLLQLEHDSYEFK